MRKWPVYAFDDLMSDETRNGTKIKTDEYMSAGLYPIVDQGQSDIAGYTNMADGLFADIPAIVFGDHTRIIKYVDQPLFLGADGVKLLKAKVRDIDYKYLYYALTAQKIPNTGYNRHFKWLKETRIPVPTLPEQKEIAEALDAVSEVLRLRKAQLAELDNLAKSQFLEIFGDQTANEKNWPQRSIGDCCILKSGTSLPADVENEGGEIPYVKVGDMTYAGNERYITTSSRFVSALTAGSGLFPIGTVIFPKRGGAIGTNKKRLTSMPICADLNIMGVIPGERLRSSYLMAYFNLIDLGSLNNGSTVPQINNKDIAPLKICIPPLALQDEYEAFVSYVNKSKLATQQALDETQRLFDSLMAEYFEE